MTMTISVQTVARQLAIPPEDLQRQAILAFLRDRTLFYNAERLRLCRKYGVSSLQEMDRLVSRGEVDEEAVLQDFQRVDFLTAELRKLEKLTKAV
jgi:hypothetical protein